MRENNKGLSYVEFLIVIAIMAIAVGLVTFSMGLVSRTNINRGADKVSSSLNQARNTAMARGSDRGTIEISYDGATYYCYVGSPTSPNKADLTDELVSSPATIYYKVQGSDDLIEVTQSNPLVIKYNQSTGAFLPMASGEYCSFIVLQYKEQSTGIQLHPVTGKSELVNM